MADLNTSDAESSENPAEPERKPGFHFKDDEAVPQTPPAPVVAPKPPAPPAKAAPATSTPPAPTAPRIPSPTVPSPQVTAPRAAAPAAPIALPKIPSPAVPSPAVKVPVAPSPAVPSPKMPVPATQAPKAAAQPAAQPAAARPAAPATPAPGGPTAPASATAPRPAGAAPKAAAPQRAPIPLEIAASLQSTAASMAEAPPKAAEGSESLWRTILDKLDPIAGKLSVLGMVAAGLALLYILYGIFGGNIGRESDPGKAAQFAANMQNATQLLRGGLIVLALCGLVMMIDEISYGIVLAIAGVAITFGSRIALAGVGNTQAVHVLIKGVSGSGEPLVYIGLFKCVIDTVRWAIDLPNRASLKADVGSANRAEPAQQRIAAKANMFSPCWQLPFCREIIRKQCPAYLARKRCWKFGRGCYCDEEMISRIVRGEAQQSINAPTRMSRQGKPPCGRCYIFLEHQSLKYKMIAPVAVPATVVAMYLVWPTWMKVIDAASTAFDTLSSKLSFSTNNSLASSVIAAGSTGKLDAYQVSQQDVQVVAQTMFGVILGFFVLIWISKFIEWAIYQMKW